MKYKVGDKVRFVKDCALDNSVIHAESVWEVSDISKEHYILVCVEKEHLLAVIDCESVDNSSELWEEKQMPKFKPKTKIVFTEDYRVAFGCVRKNTKGEVLGIGKIGDDDFYYSIAIGDERKKAHIPVENMDKVCVEDKTQDKHNILNGLFNSDGSVDGEKLMEKLESAVGDDYYEKSAMQPLEVSQVLLTKEQFAGALLFNIIKYRMRKKGQDESDAFKARQYAYWLEMVKQGKKINPSVDVVPDDYTFDLLSIKES
jgi:hypothetical protein